MSRPVTNQDKSTPAAMPARGVSEEAARQELLRVAQELIEEAGGLQVNLGSLSYEEVIKRSDVSRSTAYRIWPNREAFQLDVLCDLAGPNWQGTAAFDQETIETATSVVADHLDWLSSADGRYRLMREAVRLGARQNFEAVCESSAWRGYVALTATLLSRPADDQFRVQVQASLREAESMFIDRMAEFYTDMATILGFKMRSHFGGDFRVLAGCGAAIIEGLALRQMVVPEIVDLPIVIPGDEGDESWSLPALGFWAVLQEMIELVEDYDTGAAIQNYMKRVAGRVSSLSAL